MNMKRRFYYARVAVRRIPPPIVAVTSLFVLWYERDRLRSFGIRASWTPAITVVFLGAMTSIADHASRLTA